MHNIQNCIDVIPVQFRLYLYLEGTVGTIDPEKASNVQKTSNKRDQEGRGENLCQARRV